MANGNADFGLGEIGQVALTVEDLDASTLFYRDVLGMKLLFEAPGMAFFQCGDVRLMLGTAQGSANHPSTILYYRVADIQSAYAELRARGVDFERAPQVAHRAEGYELWLAFFRDADHNLLALMSEVSA